MFGLSLLSPWFLLGALAVAVPIVLHLRRRETAPQHAFSAVRFLRRAPFEQRRPRKLHDVLLFLLRSAALLLLAFAFARPYLAGAEIAAGTTVIAVDASFSMGAGDRMDKAKQAALRAVSGVPAGDRVAVVRFDDRAAVLTEPTFDRGAARAAVGSIAPGRGATEYSAPLAAVTRLVGTTGGRLVLVTDLQRATWTGTTAGVLADNVTLDVVDVGGTAENLSVGPVRREGEGIIAQVTNHGFQPRTTRAVLWLNDRSIAESQAAVEPGRSASVTLVARLPSAGAVRVSIDDAGGIAADDERFLVLDPPPAPAVTLLGTEPGGEDLFFLRSAIEAAGEGRRLALETLSGPARNAVTAATARERQVIVLVGTRGLERGTRAALHDYLHEGGALWLAGSETLDAGTLEEIVGQGTLRVEAAADAAFPTVLAPVDRRHPVFAAFGEAASGLGEAQFTNALRVVPGPGSRVIARFTNGLPALVEQPVGKGRLAVFASDLGTAWGTFGRRPSFVPFVLETLHYLSGLRPSPSEWLVADAPAGTLPGVVRGGVPPRPIAVNVDLRESAAARIAPADFSGAVRRVGPEKRAADAIAREREAAQDLWWYVLVAVAALLVAEGLLGHRRAQPAPPAQA